MSSYINSVFVALQRGVRARNHTSLRLTLMLSFFFPGQNIGSQESPLPYLSPQLTGQRLLVGANFASAGVGILNDTGIQFVSLTQNHSCLNK